MCYLKKETILAINKQLAIPVLKKGDKLFHYTSADALKGIAEGEFWATERSFLNDSMEFKVATEVFCEILSKHMRNRSLYNLIQKKTLDEIERLQNSALSPSGSDIYQNGDYIISFCLDYDSPLMWSSYSDYVGYCIQFDFDKLISSFDATQIDLFLHGKVIYSREEQENIIEEMIKRRYFYNPADYEYLTSWEDFDKMTDANIEDWYKSVAAEVSLYNMFFKLPCFEGEHEYRFVFIVTHDVRYSEKDIVSEKDIFQINYKSLILKQHFKVKDEVFIPFVKIPSMSLFSMEKILIGSKNKSDIALSGVRYFFRNLKHNIIIEKSEIPLRY